MADQNQFQFQFDQLENLKSNSEIEPLNWDDFHMEGRLTQVIYPYKNNKEALKVTFRTRTTEEAREIERRAVDDMFMHSMLSLATVLVSVEGQRVPNKKMTFKETSNPKGDFDEEALEYNLKLIKRMPEYLFNMLTWLGVLFNQNVLEATTFSQLKKNSSPMQ